MTKNLFKKINVFLVVMTFFCVVFSSCNRNDDAPVSPLIQDIIGTWKYTKKEKLQNGIYQEERIYLYYQVYKADGSFETYLDDPKNTGVYPAKVGTYSIQYDMVTTKDNSGEYKTRVKITGETMVQIKDGDVYRYTFTKE